MAQTEGAQTRHQSLYLDVRSNLLRGRYPAGHRFKLAEMCDEHGASVSVVREALTRLAEHGLVRLEPNKGFSVPSISDEEINDLAFVRSEIETLAVRRSIELGGLDWETEVVAAHHRFASTPNAALDEDPAANERWTEAHRRFHEACAAACGSRRLITYRTQLYDQSELIRQLAKLYGRGRRDVAGEHAGIAAAVIARNADTADDLLRRHIDATRRSCLAAWGAGGLAGDGKGAS